MDQPEKPTENAAPGPVATPPPSRWAILRQRDFWFGVGIFVIMNAALLGLTIAFSGTRIASYSGGSLIAAIALLVNILVPALLSKSHRTISHGMLYTLVFLLVAGGVCGPVFFVAWCFSQVSL